MSRGFGTGESDTCMCVCMDVRMYVLQVYVIRTYIHIYT